jgi:NAD(P)H dehydrogenase (quinone)
VTASFLGLTFRQKEQNPMILVFGATGTIGRPLVRMLAARGAPFRALVRTRDQGERLGCAYAVGDLDDPAGLAAALEGVDRVFLNGPPGPAMARQQAGAIDAAKRAGAAHIVKLSTRGASPESSVALARAHAEVEAHLRGSGLGWSTLRPASFMQNFFRHADDIKREGKFFGAYGEGRVAFLDAEDIAAAAAALLVGDARPGSSFVLTGGEALTHAEVARLFSARLGRPVAYVDRPVEQAVADLIGRGVPAEFARGLGAMMASMAAGAAAQTTDAVFELTGQPPRTFDQFLADNLDAFR